MQQERRRSLKNYDIRTREQLRNDCRALGARARQQVLQHHRGASLSPASLQDTLHASTVAAIRSSLHDGECLPEADVDELLADMQAALLADIQAELAALEHSEAQDAARAAAMVEEHEAYLRSASDQGGGEALLCPVCRSAHLVQRHGILVCPREGWQLNLAAESLRVSDVQQRLAQAYQEHGTSGCTGQLAFHIEALFGSPSLTASCERCHTLAVVL